MQQFMADKLEYGKFYHVYNRGNNYENIFTCEEDYLKFLNNVEIYISPVADVISWVLLKNHFHFMVYIKNEAEIGYVDSKNSKSRDSSKKWSVYFTNNGNQELLLKPQPVEMFKHFFNSYSRWFNIRHHRLGSLFIKNFERKPVDNIEYYKNIIVYIHKNPVKHGFVKHQIEYPWSSYLGNKQNTIEDFWKSKFVPYFENYDDFVKAHECSDPTIENSINDIIVE